MRDISVPTKHQNYPRNKVPQTHEKPYNLSHPNVFRVYLTHPIILFKKCFDFSFMKLKIIYYWYKVLVCQMCRLEYIFAFKLN